MSSIKCPQCGLVNFSTAEICKRCSFNFYSHLQTQANPSYQPPERQFATAGVPSIQKQTQSQTSEGSTNYFKKMIFGALWAIGGTIATVASYNSAGGGGKYFVFWGAILFGVIDFFIGLNGVISEKD